MSDSFFFYDLETTGVSKAKDRIMQFGGQRTDMSLKPIGKPININIRLSDDILPHPEAILVSGISPLDNQAKGISEAEFSEIFNKDIAIPSTIFTGFNNLRFDDEFIRYLNYRNFYDAYSWHWKDNASRWDILDVIRMTRALRPEGINWPFTEEGKPANKLEMLTTANKLEHSNAHDALSDALATLEVARLLKTRQPKLFSYLLNLRRKQALIELLKNNQTLVYTSSHYSSEILHTTLVYVLSLDSEMGSALVYDLRENAKDFLDLPIEELASLWEYDPDASAQRLPVKTMKLNRCPAVAPLSVLDKDSIKRLNLNMKAIETNTKLLEDNKEEFSLKLKKVAKVLDARRENRLKAEPRIPAVDERLYDKFIARNDSYKFPDAREKAKESSNFEVRFEDKRLNGLYELYRARNYPDSLTNEEKTDWNQFVRTKLFDGKPSIYEDFSDKIKLLKAYNKKDKLRLKLLTDLEVYAKTISDDYATG
ncbi:MAG: exodeoxyribonuclease I [Candidatus Saccharibacteria bacterium]